MSSPELQWHLVRFLLGTCETFTHETLGMAKPVADVAGENQRGFSTEAFSITGFSHMHDSGTGGVSCMLTLQLFNSTWRQNEFLAHLSLVTFYGKFPYLAYDRMSR